MVVVIVKVNFNAMVNSKVNERLFHVFTRFKTLADTCPTVGVRKSTVY